MGSKTFTKVFVFTLIALYTVNRVTEIRSIVKGA